MWVIESPEGGLFSFARSPYRVGGGDADDLRVEGWPEHAFDLRIIESSLVIDPHVEMTVAGELVQPENRQNLSRGTELAIGDKRMRIVTGGELGDGSTVSFDSAPMGAKKVRLEFLPRGGRLYVTMAGEERPVYLSDRRCDFIAVLLQPPEPHGPGDFVPDELVWNRVWGKQPSGKKTLHVLLHRLRKDLDRAGLDGQLLLTRSEGGGATRFTLRDGASVDVE